MNFTNINENQIRALGKVGMNMTHLWILWLLNMAREYDQEAIQVMPNLKEVNLLKNRFLIDHKGINKAGQDFYKSIVAIKEEDISKSKKKKEEKVVDNNFMYWWDSYPSATFNYRGMDFRSSRGLKTNKAVCEMLYNKVIAQGITPEQMLNALNYQVKLMKEESWESGKNKLEYMPNTETYIRQSRYEEFLTAGEEHSDEQPMDNCWA